MRDALVFELGMVGDAEAVPILLEPLENQEHSVGCRRTSAIALGVICEREPEPWTSLFTSHFDHTAVTETLISSEAEGILNRR